ncbi:MAG: hypothetical protein ACI4M6_01185 [Christensenellaceae bacterium]
MTVSSVIKQSLIMMNRSDLISELTNADMTKEVEKLLSCYNLVVSELCEEYLPVIHTETMQSASGRFYFTDFARTPLEIKAVFNVAGDEITYKKTPLYIQTDCNEAIVSYVYYPETAALNDESVYTGTKISQRILALGVSREYLLLSGLYEEAVNFDKRFQDSLAQVLLKNSGAIIRARSWF